MVKFSLVLKSSKFSLISGVKTPSQTPSAKLPSLPHPQLYTSPFSVTAKANLSPVDTYFTLGNPSIF